MQFNVAWRLLTMETQIEDIKITHSLRIPRSSSIKRESEIFDNLQYTSLKDIICNSPSSYLTLYEGNDFDSTIAIRNELVKRAASVYLQSTALLVTRNQNCFVSFWERLKNKTRLRLSTPNPFRACLWPICQFLNQVVGNICSFS
ncbi:hypothetical protein VNO80_10538 [Phaseolus coccineus]|uniref:Uncharacterized protein n=1 Tax=Phaseolus coccineus TaxID=3886 RepID=A0AAN9NDL4_PHACN